MLLGSLEGATLGLVLGKSEGATLGKELELGEVLGFAVDDDGELLVLGFREGVLLGKLEGT